MTKFKLHTAPIAIIAALALMGCADPQFSRTHVINEAPLTQYVVESDPYETIYASKGLSYRTLVDHSHYATPIINDNQPRGNSRIWGDASFEVQRASIEAIRAEASKAGMTVEQEAMVLAIAYVESGFNPDAAAGTTSAQGLGQFIRRTGAHYGLTDTNRWDVQEQARALVEHTLDNYAAAWRAGLGVEYVYARHHDGSFSNQYGGVDLAKERVMPLAQRFSDVLGS
jgi:putative chitinase